MALLLRFWNFQIFRKSVGGKGGAALWRFTNLYKNSTTVTPNDEAWNFVNALFWIIPTNHTLRTSIWTSSFGLLCGYHPFHYYATFLFKTPLSTLQYASVNHTLYGKRVMLPQLNWARRNNDGAKLSVNLRWRVIYWLVRGFRVVDVARILHVW